MGMTQLHLSVQYARRPRHWPLKAQWQTWIETALEAACAYVTLRLVDTEEGQILNATYRNKAYATNILSFPYDDIDDTDTIYGDLVVCVPVVEREAKEQGKKLDAHAAHLVIHGMLHLQGYDHETDDEAETMETKEIALLSQLGYPNPYEWTDVMNTTEESRLCRG